MDLIRLVTETEIDKEKVDKVQALYEDQFPEFVQRFISFVGTTIFLDNDYRLLSYEEILNAEKELHVDFGNKQILPLIDCGENDFISYGTHEDIWFTYNIVEDVKFRVRDNLEDLL